MNTNTRDMSNSPYGVTSLSVFFPAYNEEENIESSVKQADAVLRTLVSDYEIIVVNDGSKDRTGEIAEELALKNPRVRVVHHNPNQGYGAAVWSGIQAAEKEYIFFTDADLQFDLSEIKYLVEHAQDHDVVIGYRAKRRDPFMRLVNAKGWNVLNRILFGLRVRDIDCAFKLFKRDLVKNLPIASRGAMMSAEFLIRLSRQGVTFKEVPVTHLPRVKGSPTGAKPSVIARAFKEMLQIYTRELGDQRMVTLGRFVTLGLFNTAVDWITYGILTGVFGFFADNPTLAKGVAFLIGSIPVFVAGSYWVLPKPVYKTADRFKMYGMLAAAFAINVYSLSYFLNIGVHPFVSVVFATAASFVWNLSVAWFFFIKDRIPAFLPLYKQA